jgi:hypothetical protein
MFSRNIGSTTFRHQKHVFRTWSQTSVSWHGNLGSIACQALPQTIANILQEVLPKTLLVPNLHLRQNLVSAALGFNVARLLKTKL